MNTSNVAAGSYRGSERRHHVVFTTGNSDYHCRDQVCVAVRDRRRGGFVPRHPAIGRRLSGAIRYEHEGEVVTYISPTEPIAIGDRLFFSEGRLETEIQTTAVREIGRPAKDAVVNYLH